MKYFIGIECNLTYTQFLIFDENNQLVDGTTMPSINLYNNSSPTLFKVIQGGLTNAMKHIANDPTSIIYVVLGCYGYNLNNNYQQYLNDNIKQALPDVKYSIYDITDTALLGYTDNNGMIILTNQDLLIAYNDTDYIISNHYQGLSINNLIDNILDYYHSLLKDNPDNLLVQQLSSIYDPDHIQYLRDHWQLTSLDYDNYNQQILQCAIELSNNNYSYLNNLFNKYALDLTNIINKYNINNNCNIVIDNKLLYQCSIFKDTFNTNINNNYHLIEPLHSSVYGAYKLCKELYL